ncbi:hypothetical protein O8B93_27560 [Agrobacterium rhizogenes]|uniref:hypothetical protein n=1 Tax=Rhizobium rhizogenes TaxID=359 RepID=UPI0022B71FD7|nr:hypothetical protein [Rhizobium rhizogenes]MCZ7451323.1 hypothetical protein [Rhizobium rhizogenes]
MDFTSAQISIVEAIVTCAGIDQWEQIFVDAEIDEGEHDYSLSTVSFAVVRGTDEQLAKQPFPIDAKGQDAVLAFYSQRRNEADDRITGFDLTIERDGSFRFRFSHDEPKRARGQWDVEKARRLENYLACYRKTEGQT